MFAIAIPIYNAIDTIKDTIDSINYYCPEKFNLIFVDDLSTDGSFEYLKGLNCERIHVLLNNKKNDLSKLTLSLCNAYLYALNNIKFDLLLRMDQDTLIIKQHLLSDAMNFSTSHLRCGMFGIYDTDYNRPRNFKYHTKKILKEISLWRRSLHLTPAWLNIYKLALGNGYRPGENVFGGGYFLTRIALEKMEQINALTFNRPWMSTLDEDIYFSMATMAAGYNLGHFAAPDGPICMDWRGLPYSAITLHNSKYKLVHSVDKGFNTTPKDNNGYSAREFFRKMRHNLEE